MKKNDLKTTELYDTSYTMAKELLEQTEYPWEALPKIGEYIRELSKKLDLTEYLQIKPTVFAHKSCKIYDTAVLAENIIIGEGTEIRPGAFLRGNILVGKDCVVGNSTELKNVILFDHVQVPHYNYVGDSILGHYSHLGASALTSNVKSDKKLVVVHAEDGDLETGLKKFGAMVGDFVEVGCGSVLNPGTVIGKNSNVYPLSSVRGCVASGCIFKSQEQIVKKHE